MAHRNGVESDAYTRKFLVAQRSKLRSGCIMNTHIKANDKEEKRKKRLKQEAARKEKAEAESKRYGI